MSESIDNTVTEAEVRGFDSYQIQLGDLMRGERATLGKSLLDVQRDLRIKAAYIAAIENCDPTVFQTPGFIAGHVRSYARYLGLDPDMVFAMFCEESEFNGVHGDSKQKKTLAGFGEAVVGRKSSAVAANATPANFNAFPDPLKNMRPSLAHSNDGFFSQLSGSSISSIFVLLLLILGIGYGAWVVLQDFQRVEFAPVNESFTDVAGLSPNLPRHDTMQTPSNDDTASADVLDRLYRPQHLEVPVLVARDAPIATLDPDKIGALMPGAGLVVEPEVVDTIASGPKVVKEAVLPISVVASRAAWVRVSLADGSILFEKILNAGESFKLPSGVEPPILRAGNAGFVFVTLGDQTFGPLGDGTSVAKNISLAATDIKDVYTTVQDMDQLRQIENPKVITLNQFPTTNP